MRVSSPSSVRARIPRPMEQLLVDARGARLSLQLPSRLRPRGGPGRNAMRMRSSRPTRRRCCGFRQPKGFRTWLYRTVKNACLMSRRTKVDNQRGLEFARRRRGSRARGDRADPEERTAAAAERRRFQAAFRKLPRPYRLVAFLARRRGLSTKEVAQVVGISEANVSRRLHRSLARVIAGRGACRMTRQRATSHRDVDPYLWSRYLDGEFTSVKCRACEAHLMECADCRAKLRGLRLTVTALHAAARAAVTARGEGGGSQTRPRDSTALALRGGRPRREGSPAEGLPPSGRHPRQPPSRAAYSLSTARL